MTDFAATTGMHDITGRGGVSDAVLASRRSATVILGVAASDAHAVANRLIELQLSIEGFRVLNLGTCTTIDEFAAAARATRDARAILIGSLNGHAFEDLRPLGAARRNGDIRCPVILGGNIPGGDDAAARARLGAMGVDTVVKDPDELPALLDRLSRDCGRLAA